MSKKTEQVEYLPQGVVTAIEALNLKGFHKANAVQVTAAIINLGLRSHKAPEEYQAIAQPYFFAISNNYGPAMAALKKAAIVQVYTTETGAESYQVGKSGKAYRVNPVLRTGELAPVSYTIKKESFRTDDLSEQMKAWILADLQGLECDAEEAQSDLRHAIEYLDTRAFQVTKKSPEYVLNTYSENVRFGSNTQDYKYRIANVLDYKLLEDENAGKALWRQGDDFVIDTEANYKRKKQGYLNARWNQVICSFQKSKFFATRASNGRIHTNVTECPVALLNSTVMTFRGEALEEIDIANSQMAALAHVLQNGDVLRDGIEFPAIDLSDDKTAEFIQHSQSSSIYSEVAKILGVTRDEAKTEMFRNLFGGINRASRVWLTLKAEYPGVCAWLQQIKEIQVDGKPFNLAVYLQRLEAKVMIENVYVAIKKASHTAFSKHDSFLVPQSQVEAVKAIVEAEFERLGYQATLKNKTVAAEVIPTPATTAKTSEKEEVGTATEAPNTTPVVSATAAFEEMMRTNEDDFWTRFAAFEEKEKEKVPSAKELVTELYTW